MMNPLNKQLNYSFRGGLTGFAGGGPVRQPVPAYLWEYNGRNAIDLTDVVTGLAAAEGNPDANCFGLINTYFSNNAGRKLNHRFYLPEGNWYTKQHLFMEDAVNFGIFGNKQKTIIHKAPTALTATATTNGSNNNVTFSNTTNIVNGQMVLIEGIPDPRMLSSVSGTSAVLDGALPPAVTNAPAAYFQNEYMMFFRYCNNIILESLTLRGAHVNPATNRFGEQGIYLGSCVGTNVNYNRFYDIGDALCRDTTSGNRSETNGSFYHRFTNNYSENCSQYTTTPGGSNNVLGGGQNTLVEGNVFVNLKGSVKLATRSQVGSATVRKNIIHNTTRDTGPTTSCGIEIIGRNNIMVVQNEIVGSANWGIAGYTPTEGLVQSYAYGNYLIADNDITDVYRGIFMQNNPFPLDGGGGTQVNPQNIRVNDNRITNVASTEGPASGIAFSSSGGASTWGTGCEARNNTLRNVANGTVFSFQNVANSGNTSS